jgi:NADH dehydrogenase FAD-containing subunit
VDEYLRVPDAQDVLAIGDAAAARGSKGELAMLSAPAMHSSGTSLTSSTDR